MSRIVRQTTGLLAMTFALLLIGCNTTPSEFTASPATMASPVVQQSPMLPLATLMPTLSVEQRESQILELLQTNGGCELPCWWGIIPGTSTWPQTQAFLEGLGVKTSINRTLGNAIDYGTSGLSVASRNISLGVGFTAQDGIIEEIWINSSSINHNSPSGWLEAWADYSPKQIISRYGAPDRAWLMTSSQVHEPPESSQMPYELWFFYDDLKFLIRYVGVVDYAPVYRFCPAYGQNRQLTPELRIFLADPANLTPLETLSNALSTPGMTDYIQPIEKATGLTMKQVSSLFTQNSKEACFDAPRDTWP